MSNELPGSGTSAAAAHLELLQSEHFEDTLRSEIFIDSIAFEQRGVRPRVRREDFVAALVADWVQVRTKAGQVPSPPDIEVMRAHYEAQCNVESLRVPTIYQDRGEYAILSALVDTIEATALECDVTLPPRPCVGTLPIGRLNAMVIAVPGSSETLLVFQRCTFAFLNLLVKAVVETFDNDGAGQFSLDTFKRTGLLPRQVAERFRALLDAYLFKGDPVFAPSYLPDRARSELVRIVLEAAELFLVGHEYGHLCYGHLEQIKPRKRRVRGAEVMEYPFEWTDELAADFFGFAMMGKALEREGILLNVSGAVPMLVFSAMEIVERAQSVIQSGVDEPRQAHTSHPPLRMRHKGLQTFLREKAAGLAEEAIGLAYHFDLILEELWASSRDAFFEYHQQGRQLDGMWHA